MDLKVDVFGDLAFQVSEAINIASLWKCDKVDKFWYSVGCFVVRVNYGYFRRDEPRFVQIMLRWAYDFFEAAPQARPLRTHLIANNLFLKFWYNEYYIPKSMRLGQNMRFIRMLVSAIFIFSKVVLIVSHCRGKVEGAPTFVNWA